MHQSDSISLYVSVSYMTRVLNRFLLIDLILFESTSFWPVYYCCAVVEAVDAAYFLYLGCSCCWALFIVFVCGIWFCIFYLGISRWYVYYQFFGMYMPVLCFYLLSTSSLYSRSLSYIVLIFHTHFPLLLLPYQLPPFPLPLPIFSNSWTQFRQCTLLPLPLVLPSCCCIF